QTDYTWEATNYKRPNKEKLVAYELLIRDFVEKHNYQTLIDTLDYLENLGITAIELMPINEFEGNNSWGYNPNFLFAPDKYYGTESKLKEFIDECHKRNIAVIQDMVLNHSFGSSPFVRLYESDPYGPPSAENPWLNISDKHPYGVGYDFNHESQKTKELVKRVLYYWMQEYKIDGFRFDLSKGFTQNYTTSVGAWGNYDQSRINIWKNIADKMWAVDDSSFVILEHFADNSEEQVLANYGMILWGNSTHDYQEAGMGYNADFSWGYYSNRTGWTKPNLITYMESHDEERVMYKNILYGNSSGSYNITQLSTALDRIKLNATFFLTLPGPKMIWQFEELGYDISINENGRTGEKPIHWEYLQDSDRKSLYNTFRALLKIRNENEVFTAPNVSINFVLGTSNDVKSIKISGSPNTVIYGNFGVVGYYGIDVGFQHGGDWYDYFYGDTIHADGSTDKIDLEPGEFHIFTDVKLELPAGMENDSTGVAINNNGNIINTFKLSQNYPNPFNPTTTINYQIPTNGLVSITLYNVAGQKVKTLLSESKTVGKYSYKLNAENLASGIYFYKVDFKNGNNSVKFSETMKMLLLK
ncbi:MAG: alpha-amylase family glycosyl hydrolase, partial [Candidatus Marinimicrobia bacterium]|nr:alpha-amylase family glycosyl hydrolase [Candidatus Neomarinimicrobiota bacterium]